MTFILPKIYPITDAQISGITHAEQVRRMADGGARLIQLREKDRPLGDWFTDALQAVKIAHEFGIKIVVNDRVDLALAIGADGVHLGQDDLPPDAARRLLGNNAIIGYSTHNLEQAGAAMRLPIDYIAFGPIFTTSTKKNPYPIVGLDLLQRVRLETGDFPLVAIGGIKAENLLQVLDAGADSAAMIGAVISEPAEITARMQHLMKISE